MTEQSLAGEHEKILLIGFPVVHGHRLTRPEHNEGDSDLREVCLALETQTCSPRLRVAPASRASIQDEPSLTGSGKSVLGLLQRGLGNHRPIIRTRDR